MTYADLYRKMSDQPFKPFRIKLVNDSSIEILEPWMAIIGESSAVVATEAARDDRGARYALNWKTISIARILKFNDIATKRNGSAKKR